MSIFYLPDLGEGLPDAEIREWYVKEGDVVMLDQPLASMETAKAVVDVPSPQAGKILKLHGSAGDIIKTGAPLVEFDHDAQQEKHRDSGTVVGDIVVGSATVKETAVIRRSENISHRTVQATPAVRVLAQKLSVDLSHITPTGPHGVITLQDVERAHSPSASSAPSPLAEDFELLHGVRRMMAINMAKSHAAVVPVTLNDEADIHHWSTDTDITVRVLRALIFACQQEPALNAWYDTHHLARRLFKQIHVGLAMDSDDGLFVPVIKELASHSPAVWRSRINQFKTQIKTRSIPAEDLRGASIVLSNFGNFAGRFANPVVVPPSVAILGTGKIRDAVVAHAGNIVIHRLMPLSLTFDHRAVTGGEAARFLKAVMEDLEKSA